MTVGGWLVTVGLGIGVYAYAVYPLLVWVAARRRGTGLPGVSGDLPQITITVPAYNEEATIRATLETILGIDYPAERRHVLVVSDASTDRTDEIVAEFAERGVELLRLPTRSGKTAAENAARTRLRGDIVVNTDASVRLHPNGLKPLMSAFSDPTVGVASGRDVSVAPAASTANAGESAYVGYEMTIRDLETRTYGIVGASGCFYAIRRHLHTEVVPQALSRDFAAPLIAREHGYRSVSVNDSICYVPRSASLRREYRRKVRTMTRGLETLFYKRHLLNPFRYGVFGWMLASHKLMRWLTPWGIILAGVGIALLARSQVWALWVAGALAVGVAAGVVGWVWPAERRLPRLLSLPTYVVMGVVAALHSWIRAVHGDRNPIWEPTRRPPVDAAVPKR